MNQVFATSLHHIQHNYRFLLQTGITYSLHVVELHGCYILQVHNVTFFVFNHDVFQLFGVAELTQHPDGSAYPTIQHIATRLRQIFRTHGIFNIAKTELTRLKLVWINLNFDLFIINAADIRFRDLGDLLNLILQVLGMFLQLLQRVVTRQVNVHDGELREVDIKHVWIGRKILR